MHSGKKGLCFPTCNFLAVPEERQRMKTPKAYRFHGRIYALLAAMFYLAAGLVAFEADWIFPVILGLAGLLIVYALTVSIRGELGGR